MLSASKGLLVLFQSELVIIGLNMQIMWIFTGLVMKGFARIISGQLLAYHSKYIFSLVVSAATDKVKFF